MRVIGTARVVIVAIAAAASAAPPEVADPLVGAWRTFDDHTGAPRAILRIARHGDTYEGRIVRGLAPGDDPNARCVRCTGARRDQPLRDMVVLEGLRKDGDAYRDGRILDPDNGATYRCEVHVAPDGRSLTIRGYIGIPLLGRTQTWRREPE